MRKCLYYLVFSFLFIVGAARAMEVSGLNVATVLVENASTAARQAALPNALGQALIKMSGNPAVMTLPTVQNALDDTNALIQSYGYSNQNQPDGQMQLLLQITFDSKALKQLLRKAGQADWSSDRPLTLLWVQTQNGGQPQILSNTNDTQLSQDILKVAKTRGVPVLLPAMDLDDQAFMNTGTDAFDPSLLKQAMKRYAAAAVLAGNIQQNENQWQGQWILLMDNTPYRWRNTEKSMDDLLTRAMNDVANLMANQLAVVDKKGLQTGVTLDITNVTGLADYAKVLSTLRHLSPVANVSIKDMSGSDLLLQIKTIGGEQALSDALSLEQNFSAIESPDNSDGKADLYYRWNGLAS